MFFGVVIIFLTYLRATWLALLFVLVVAAILYARMFHLFDSVSLLTGGILLLFIFTIPPESLRKQGYIAETIQNGKSALKMTKERISSTSQIRSRVITGYSGIRMFVEKPLQGWGYETYNLQAKEFVRPIGQLKTTEYERILAPSHNTYITFLAETGLIGFLSYIFPIRWWLISSICSYSRLKKTLSSDRFLNTRFWVMLWANLGFIVIISSMIDIRFFPFTLVQVWLILGLISNLVHRGKMGGQH